MAEAMTYDSRHGPVMPPSALDLHQRKECGQGERRTASEEVLQLR